MSDYRIMMLDLAKNATDEEFSIILSRFNALSEAIVGIGKAIEIIAPNILQHMADDGEVGVNAEGMCNSCARPCEEAQPGTLNCTRWNEFIKDKCVLCEYWDSETCQFSGSCENASMFSEYEKPTIQIFPGEEIEV